MTPERLNDEPLPEGFRMTELGALPAHWKVVKLGEVVEKLRSGGTPRRNNPEYWNGNIPFVLIEDMTNCGLYLSHTKECISQAGLENSNAWIVPSGTLLLSMYATIGVTAINLIPVATNQAILAIIPKPELDTIYAAYLLNFHADRLKKYNVQSTQKNINKGIVQEFPIPLPPLEEQQAIAHVLRTVQEARDAAAGVAAALRELKRSLMRHLFAYGPIPPETADRLPLQDTELGALPAHWKVVKLGEVFDIMQGKSLSSKKNKGVRPRLFLRTSNIYWGKIDLTSVDSMDFSEEEETKYALQYGDLLVCEGGEVGRTAFWEGNISNIFFQNHLHRLRAKNQNVSPRFVMYWLQTAFTLLNLYTGTSNKTTIPNLSRGRLSAFPIPLPPLEEQQEIARILQAVDDKIAAEESRQQALEALFQSLLHHLMTGKVRVPPTLEAPHASCE